MNFLGLDVGTTTVTAVVVASETGDVVAKATAPNDAETTSDQDKRLGRSEWDPARILSVIRQVLGEAASQAQGIAGIGVTGQMHGMLLVDGGANPVGPFFGWQDQRATEPHPSADGTVVAALTDLVESADPDGTVIRPKTGYLGATLSWLLAHDAVPSNALATFLPDFVSAQLTSTQPVTDPTNAAGSGLFDVVTSRWHEPLLERAGIDGSLLPRVVQSGTSAGHLVDDWAEGLDAGIPVCVACGDNQASFLGSVRDPGSSVLINVGTGGQVSVSSDMPLTGPGLEARPYVDGNYILVGAGLVGGRTYAWLRDFYLAIGRTLFDVDASSEDVYERMTKLASDVDAGSDGLSFEPLFTGTREEPSRRGSIEGIGTTNFSPGHVSRALLEGMIGQFRWLYGNALEAGAVERSTLVGAGNGIRKNAVLREIAEKDFGLKMQVPVHTEEAAFGAAMQAMVLGGCRKDLKDAGETIRY